MDFHAPPEQEQLIEGFFVIALVLIVAVIAWPILAEEWK